jgi:RNA polymerase sigma-70 factor (ECF subfamily)
MAGNLVRLVRVDDPISDAQLVESARTGDLGAKRQLFDRYVQMASGLAFRLMGDDVDLDDIVQDSFISAFSQIAKLENPQAFRAWMASIVTRTAIATMRRRTLLCRLGLRRREPVRFEALISAGAAPDVVAELRDVCSVIDRLPTDERVVFVLRRIEQLALEEIAEQTRASLATVKRRLARAEARLALALEGQRGKP